MKKLIGIEVKWIVRKGQMGGRFEKGDGGEERSVPFGSY